MKSITVDGTAEDCYRAWRDHRNLPRFLSFVENVRPLSDGRYHWVARDGDDVVEMEVDIVEEKPGVALTWRSIPGSDMETVGEVEFERAAGGRGTIVRLGLEPPGSKAREAETKRELHRFKQWFETGEVATTEGQPVGRKGGRS